MCGSLYTIKSRGIVPGFFSLFLIFTLTYSALYVIIIIERRYK
nr:MAG TPA: hypothetical protein [Caudoviricetes sp.]